MLDVELAIADLAARQGGAFSLDQARALGATSSLLRRRRGSGQWRDVAPHVVVLPGTPDDERRLLWTIQLTFGSRAVLSHETSGRCQRVPAIPSGAHTVSIGWGHHRTLDGVRVHQQRVDERDVNTIDGLRMTNVPRTVCDLAMVFSRARLARVVDGAHFDLGCSYASIGETLLRVGTAGRPRASQLIAVLDDRGPGREIATTVLEVLLDEVLTRAVLPPGQPQYPLPGSGRRQGLVDRAFPEAKLIVEADGRRWHARRDAMATDRQRDMEAARAGWMTLRPMYEHLRSDPDDTAAAIQETYLGRLHKVA